LFGGQQRLSELFGVVLSTTIAQSQTQTHVSRYPLVLSVFRNGNQNVFIGVYFLLVVNLDASTIAVACLERLLFPKWRIMYRMGRWSLLNHSLTGCS